MQSNLATTTEALSVDDAARRVGLGRTFIYQALSPDQSKRNGLPHLKSLKVGKRRLIRAQTLREWLAELEQTDEQSPAA
jgi:excisionase family DNA binding protein